MKSTSRVVFCCLVFLWNLPSSAQSPTDAQLARAQGAHAGEVDASAGLSLSKVETGEKIRFWITVENPTQNLLADVRIVRLDAQGFRWTLLSWRMAQGDRSCLPPAALPQSPVVQPIEIPATCEPLAATLEPGQSLVVMGELVGVDPHPPLPIYAELSWKDKGEKEAGRVLPLGEASVTGCWDNWPSFYQAVKDLALPVILLFFGVLLSLWQKERAQISETWSKMLPISHRLATRHYLVIAGAVAGILARDAKMKEIKDEDQDLATNEAWREHMLRQFYYIAFLERHYYHMVHTSGGFYFKNRVGESVVQECYNRFLDHYTKAPPADKLTLLTAVAETMDLKEGFHSFRQRWTGSGESVAGEKTIVDRGQMIRAWQDFQQWRGSKDYPESIRYLSAFNTILLYEINRPYEYWYGEKEKLELLPAVKQTLDEIAIDLAETDLGFAAKYQAYLREPS